MLHGPESLRVRRRTRLRGQAAMKVSGISARTRQQCGIPDDFQTFMFMRLWRVRGTMGDLRGYRQHSCSASNMATMVQGGIRMQLEERIVQDVVIVKITGEITLKKRGDAMLHDEGSQPDSAGATRRC